VRNPVETRKLKFDGSAKAAWNGDRVEASPGGWMVVFYEQPAHEAAGAPVTYALRYFHTELPLSVLVSFDAAGEALEYQCDAALAASIDGPAD